MLTDLCDDIQGILLQKLDNTTLIMLLYVSKKYYDIVSKYGKINKHFETVKWAKENNCDWDYLTEITAKQTWPEIFKTD
jgi:hypothetical protein